MRECHSFNHILEYNEMNEREGRKRLILRIDKKNDCFGRERYFEGNWGIRDGNDLIEEQ